MKDNAWMVIVNPKAGNGSGLRDWPTISNQMYNNGIQFTCVFTEHKFHAVELTVRAINDGYRNIVAVGGDGTIHEVVNGIFIQHVAPTTAISLAVIPAGTGNDWVRMYGISKTYSLAVKSIVEKRTLLQDVVKVNYYETGVQHTRYMANVAGVGYDAVVNLKYNNLKDEGKYGKWLYIRSTFHTFLKYRSNKFSFEVDGKPFYKGMVFSSAIGIGKFNGGGMMQTPNASVNDELMDLTVVNKMSKYRVIRKFKLLYSGNIYSMPKVLFTQAKSVKVNSWPESRIEIDGEAVGTSPFEFNIVPHAINVVVGVEYKM